MPSLDECIVMFKNLGDKNIREDITNIIDSGVADPIKLLRIVDDAVERKLRSKYIARKNAIAIDSLKTYFDNIGVSESEALTSLITQSFRTGDKASGIVSLELRAKAVTGQWHKEMTDMLEAMKMKKFGFENSNEAMRNVVKELFNPGTSGDPDAKKFAKMWKTVSDRVREDYNTAGGQIRDLKSWALPTHHNADLIMRIPGSTAQKFASWSKFIRPLLDEKFIKAQNEFTDEQFEEALGRVFNNIRTGGVGKKRFHDKSTLGMIDLSKRHMEHRFLHFKDGDSWLKYQDKFGNPNHFASMTDYMEIMGREVAAMQMLGPNPDATLKYLKEMLVQRTGDQQIGTFAQNTYNNLMNRTPGYHNVLSDTSEAIRNIGIATKLGFATISAMSDLSYTAIAARANNMSIMKTYSRALSNLVPGNTEDMQLAARLGFMAEYTIDRAVSGNRVAEISGHGMASRLADSSVRLSGLNAWTLAMKNAFQLEFLANIATYSDSTFAKLPKKLRKSFETYGINANDWDTITAHVEHHRGINYVNPSSFNNDDITAKLVGAITEETRYAVPEPNIRTRTIIVGDTRAGTLSGEMRRNMGQFKSFAISSMLGPFMRAAQAPGFSKINSMASLLVGTSLLGMLAYQAKELARGRDLLDWKSGELWMHGLDQGGSLGLVMDIFNAFTRNYSSGIGELLAGPPGQDISNALTFVFGSMKDVVTLEKSLAETGRKAVAGIGETALKHIPYTNMWYDRLAFDRFLKNQVNKLLNPDFEAEHDRMLQYYNKREQEEYWKMGEALPSRAPSLGFK